MPKVAYKYETIFITDTSKGEEYVNSIVEKFKNLISSNGTIENVDVWGNRRLAYPINDMTEGHYTLINFESGSDFPAELDRIYKITDGVLRSLIIAKN